MLKLEWLGPGEQGTSKMWGELTQNSKYMFPISPLLRFGLCMHRAILKAYQMAAAIKLRAKHR